MHRADGDDGEIGEDGSSSRPLSSVRTSPGIRSAVGRRARVRWASAPGRSGHATAGELLTMVRSVRPFDIAQAGESRRSLVNEDLHAVLNQRCGGFADACLLLGAYPQTFRKRLVAFLPIDDGTAVNPAGKTLRHELHEIPPDRLVADPGLIDEILDVTTLLADAAGRGSIPGDAP